MEEFKNEKNYLDLFMFLFIGCSRELDSKQVTDKNIQNNMQNHEVVIRLQFRDNLVFSKYNLDIYVDDEIIGKIEQGENKGYILYMSEGIHKLVFAKEGEQDFSTTKTLEITGTVEKSYKLSAKHDKINIEETNDTIEIDTFLSIATATPTNITTPMPSETLANIETSVPTEPSSNITTTIPEVTNTPKPQKTQKPKSNYKLKISRHRINGAPKPSGSLTKFEKEAVKIVKSYRCKKVYFEYQIDGSLYLEIKCKNDESMTNEMANKLITAKNKNGYTKTVYLSFIDQTKQEDESGIVIANFDI